MYKIGDIVVYENGGVCKVSDIGTPDFLKSDTKFYTLQPMFDHAGMIYVKIENDKHILKPLMTKEEADAVFSQVPAIEPLYSKNDKQRDQDFKNALRSCDATQWFAMLKGILSEKKKREKNGKKLNMSDDRNMQKVVRLLSTEMSVVYDIPVDDAKERVAEAVSA